MRRLAIDVEDASLAELEVTLAGSDTSKLWPLLHATFGSFIPSEEEEEVSDVDSDEYLTEEEEVTIGDAGTEPTTTTSSDQSQAQSTEQAAAQPPDVKPKDVKPKKRKAPAPRKLSQPSRKVPPPAPDTPFVSPEAKKAENAGLSEQHNIDRDPAQKETTYICRECPFYGNNKRSAVVHV